MSNVKWDSKRPQPKVQDQYQNGFNQTYKLQKGNTAWDIAKAGLISKGRKPTNKEIMNEINRLAKINGCNNIEEFTKMFIVGKEIRIAGHSPEADSVPYVKGDEKPSIFLAQK